MDNAAIVAGSNQGLHINIGSGNEIQCYGANEQTTGKLFLQYRGGDLNFCGQGGTVDISKATALLIPTTRSTTVGAIWIE